MGNTNPIMLNISASAYLDPLKSSENRYITYSVDGQANVTMTPIYQGTSSGDFSFSSVVSQIKLPSLSDGWHVIMVYVKYNYGTWLNEGSARVEFAVGKPTTLNPFAPFLRSEIPARSQVFPVNQPIPYFLNISIPLSWFENKLLNGEIKSVSYVLDNSGDIVSIAGSDMSQGGPHSPIVINGSKPAYIPLYTANHPNIILTGTIPAQESGNHTIDFIILWSDYGDNYMTGNFVTYFSVSDKISQAVNIPTQLSSSSEIFVVLSPKEQATYNTNQVPITCLFDSKVEWSYYALDTPGQPQSSDWKLFNGNTTLTGLTEGSHKLIISVKIETNVPSYPVLDQTIFFNIDINAPMTTNSSSVDPTPITPEFSWLAILLLFILGLSVAITVRKGKTLKPTCLVSEG